MNTQTLQIQSLVELFAVVTNACGFLHFSLVVSSFVIKMKASMATIAHCIPTEILQAPSMLVSPTKLHHVAVQVLLLHQHLLRYFFNKPQMCQLFFSSFVLEALFKPPW